MKLIFHSIHFSQKMLHPLSIYIYIYKSMHDYASVSVYISCAIEPVRELNSRHLESKALFVKDGWWMMAQNIFLLIYEWMDGWETLHEWIHLWEETMWAYQNIKDGMAFSETWSVDHLRKLIGWNFTETPLESTVVQNKLFPLLLLRNGLPSLLRGSCWIQVNPTRDIWRKELRNWSHTLWLN